MITLDEIDHKLDQQQIFINSSSTTHDPVHLLHQIHAPRSFMLTLCTFNYFLLRFQSYTIFY